MRLYHDDDERVAQAAADNPNCPPRAVRAMWELAVDYRVSAHIGTPEFDVGWRVRRRRCSMCASGHLRAAVARGVVHDEDVEREAARGLYNGRHAAREVLPRVVVHDNDGESGRGRRPGPPERSSAGPCPRDQEDAGRNERDAAPSRRRHRSSRTKPRDAGVISDDVDLVAELVGGPRRRLLASSAPQNGDLHENRMSAQDPLPPPGVGRWSANCERPPAESAIGARQAY